MRPWPGHAYPLGATYDGSGTNFAIFSEVAEKVELCLFSPRGKEQRIPLSEVDGFVHHGYLPGVEPGQRYGYRVHGPYDAAQGLRCNPQKLLIDPYAKAIDGPVRWERANVLPYVPDPENPDADLELDDEDSAPAIPKSVVVDPHFDWEGDRPPRRPWSETIIYETHVKGFTKRHPDVPEELRGTYAGVAHPATIEHLSDLGVTALELLPVHQFVQDDTL
ncbi:MAG: glycogen debranching enzyme, partial [Actinomycetes bacterium]